MNDTNQAQKPVEPSATAKTVKSKGEKFFDRAVYGGIAGVGTFVATLFMSYKLEHGQLAAGRYSKLVDWVEKRLGSFFSTKISRGAAEESVMATSLMMGGNAMLVLVGLAEHYKIQIVAGFNAAFGDKTPPELIEKTPKQTWRSLIEGRLLAWGVVFTALFSAHQVLPKTFSTFKAEFGARTYQAVQWLKREPALVEMEQTRAYRIGKLAALDIFATTAAAAILYVGGHFFARKQEEKKAQRAEHKYMHNGAALDLASGVPDEVNPSVVIGGERSSDGKLQQVVLGSSISK